MVRPDHAIERNWCYRCMHYTSNYKSRKCKLCDVFFNPLEVYEGKTPNNFEEGYRTQILIDKNSKKVYINVDEVKDLFSEYDINELSEAGCVPATSEQIKNLQKEIPSSRKQTVKGKTTIGLFNKIKVARKRIE